MRPGGGNIEVRRSRGGGDPVTFDGRHWIPAPD